MTQKQHEGNLADDAENSGAESPEEGEAAEKAAEDARTDE
jgi:hypothetical protein